MFYLSCGERRMMLGEEDEGYRLARDGHCQSVRSSNTIFNAER
jgi:hypothetical protein